eukprot:160401-Chlamydomonas_euryale.AAC.1
MVAAGAAELAAELLGAMDGAAAASGGGGGAVCARDMRVLCELAAGEVALQRCGGVAGGASAVAVAELDASEAGGRAHARVRRCLLGARLVLALFSRHVGARGALLARLRRAAEGARPSGALPAVLALGMVVRCAPRSALRAPEVAAQLRLALGAVPALACDSARQCTLLALWPACRAQRELHDMAVMMLRK